MPTDENLDRFKSNKIADVLRAEGNKLYSERNFFDALVKYNESLCHSSPNSEAMGLAYANRSAVYFEMKMFEKCLKNIEMAKSFGYPQNKLKILENRIEKCGEGIKDGNELKCDENEAEEFLKLSYKANDRLPFVVKCLEMRKSKNFGRFIVTNEDLKVGDILAIEKPHFKILKSDSRYESCQEMNKYQRCAVCLKDNLMDLIPCLGCNSSKIL
jgi:tetratricopeptide (TPR) repeat protein